MFQSVAGFFKRHRTAFVVSAGVVGGIYWVGQYAKKKIVEMQTSMAKERMLQENLRRRFEQNQHDCTFTVMSLLPALCEPILDTMNVERLVQALKEYRKPGASTPSPALSTEPEGLACTPSAGSTRSQSPASHDGGPAADFIHPTKSKVELWEDIKLTSFTRLLTSLYCLNLLTVFVYLQLNLIGRFIYTESLATISQGRNTAASAEPNSTKPPTPAAMSASTETSGARRLPFAIEQSYLTFSWWFLHVGWQACHERVAAAVAEVLNGVSLKQKLTHLELMDLIDQVRTKVEKSDQGQTVLGKRFLSSLLPATDQDLRRTLTEGGANPSALSHPQFQQLLNETRDLLESTDFELVCTRCLDRSFVLLNDTLHQFYPELPLATATAQSRTFAAAQDQIIELSESAGQGSVDLVEEFANFQVDEPRLALATLIPRVTREVHQLLNGFPNQYLDAITKVSELQAFSAIIYTTLDPY
ncbi:peroxin [Dimargaris verticillata]|uniref:Peroxin n=1 Tax=Dimargaris verticillata TaxID=2761393 RepID=A0A9W8B931_9FUNG|nr:peroxin [Dimargaris verticillata]